MLSLSLILFSSCNTNVKRIIEKADNATFIIYTFDELGNATSGGSGFFIDTNGTGITNFHVLENATHATIRTANGREYMIDAVIVSDRHKDIAKFSIQHNGERFNALRFSRRQIERGDVVYNISSPFGHRNSFFSGVVSALRTEGLSGKEVQFTSDLAAGSSGSPVLDRRGNVFAVFTNSVANSLQFGTMINQEVISSLNEHDFPLHNPQFNAQSNIVILNRFAENSVTLMLNAIEFGADTTTLHLSATNLSLRDETTFLWLELNEKEDGFTLVNLDTDTNYYIISSTVGTDAESAIEVQQAETYTVTAHFPAMSNDVRRISVYVNGKNSDFGRFTNIDLDQYRHRPNIGAESQHRDWALGHLSNGEYYVAFRHLSQLVEVNPTNIFALNALGALSYILERDERAIDYFSRAIEANPTATLAYENRFTVFRNNGFFLEAVDDVTQIINLSVSDEERVHYLVYRILLYQELEDWENFNADIDTVYQLTDDVKDRELLQEWRESVMSENEVLENE
jgi:serine protease Do